MVLPGSLFPLTSVLPIQTVSQSLGVKPLPSFYVEHDTVEKGEEVEIPRFGSRIETVLTGSRTLICATLTVRF